MILIFLWKERVYMNGNNIKITLSGSVGSGKSTIGKLIQESLQIDFFSMGQLARRKALSLGMDIDAFQKFLLIHPEMDMELDNFISSEMNKKSNFILDYRLGYHFIKGSFNVLLDVNEEIALKRISNRNSNNENYENLSNSERLLKLHNRNTIMRERFIHLYNADFLKKNNYLVIDTSHLNPL
jgi:radical S-adenosyl methionine domain-containing protein 2